MAQNTAPIYSQVPIITAAQLTSSTTASTRSDGVGTIGTDLIKAFTANATNGSFVSKLRILATASTPTTMQAATVIRIFISSITSSTTLATNTFLFNEVSTAAIPAANAANATNYYEVPINLALPASYTILVSIHVQPTANTTWQCVVYAGDY